MNVKLEAGDLITFRPNRNVYLILNFDKHHPGLAEVLIVKSFQYPAGAIIQFYVELASKI